MPAWSSLIALASVSVAAQAVQLPSIHVPENARGDQAVSLLATSQATWWARVGDRVYTSPPSSSPGLSQRVGDYYYAIGSDSALTDEMKAHRVGGEGRWHVFHLPEGPSLLQTNGAGDRRSVLSSLVQLSSGVVLKDDPFPQYEKSGDYKNPLSAAAQQLENTAAGTITAQEVESYLSGLTGGGSSANTRSWTNPDASKSAEDFLQKQFQDLGLTSCLHVFHQGGKELVNVVALLPGKSLDSVTVGAHYDSRPFDGAAPGAEDNGSGVAALLAIAKAFSESGVKPVRNVYFVAFAAEEPGLWGSDAFASELAGGEGGIPAQCRISPSFLQQARVARNTSHEAIIMDEVGWRSPKYSTPTVNLESFDWSREVMEHLADASQTHNGQALAIVHNNAPFGSDHMSFLNRGMKAVLTINADDEGYPNYHKSSDTISNVTPEYAAQIAKMVFGGALRIAGAQPGAQTA